MRRHLRPSSAHSAGDLASLVAALSAGGLALLTWIVADAVGDRMGIRTAEVDEAPQDTTMVDLAEVDTAPKHAVTTAKTKKHFNVVLITVDTLRSDLGFAGYPRPVSPNLDELAARSSVYESAYAMASFTPKCLGPLLIGKYVSETHRDYEHYTVFYPANVFLAERVHAAGGRTVGAASHRYFGWKTGFEQGFDTWDTTAIPPKSIDNDPTITSDRMTDVAIDLLGAASTHDVVEIDGARPPGPASNHFFAWFHYLDPHLPYVSHPGAPDFATMPGARKERAPYDAEVWYTDQQVGRLLSHIDKQPWAKETAIILTADHGEAFGERGHWGHGRELWEPLVHVPLLVYVPGVAPRRIKAKRSHIDVVPTVLELMGIPADPELHGKSLARDARVKQAEIEERDIYIDMPAGPFNEARRAVITGNSPGYKLIDFGTGRYELFDLQADPREAKNLALEGAAQFRQAKEALGRIRSTVRELPPSK